LAADAAPASRRSHIPPERPIPHHVDSLREAPAESSNESGGATNSDAAPAQASGRHAVSKLKWSAILEGDFMSAQRSSRAPILSLDRGKEITMGRRALTGKETEDSIRSLAEAIHKHADDLSGSERDSLVNAVLNTIQNTRPIIPSAKKPGKNLSKQPSKIWRSK
jgi:hypothetical protein